MQGTARRAIFAAALAGLLFGFDTAVVAGVATPMADEFGLDETGKGLAIASALVGTLIGSLSAGVPGDRYGSRTVLLWVGVAFVLSGIGCALAGGVTSFVAFRLLGGLAIGGASVLAPVFIAEVSPAERRGLLVGLFQLSVVTGILAAYLSNAAVTQLVPGPEAWRWKLGVLVVPGAVFLAAMAAIPHSPRWLLSKGRMDEARAVAARLGLTDLRFDAAPDRGARLDWRRHRTPILLALALASFNQLSGINAILYYLNDIFAAAGFSAVSADLQSIGIGVANLCATLFAMTIIDRVGRRVLLLVGSVGCAVALFGVALVYSTTGAESWLLPLLVLFIVFFAISQGAVIWVYISEIFPTAVRARGQALGSATHWIWATILSFGFPVVAEGMAPAAPFWLFAGAMVLQFVIVWRFFPETKGVVLEDMDAALGAGRNHQEKPVG